MFDAILTANKQGKLFGNFFVLNNNRNNLQIIS